MSRRVFITGMGAVTPLGIGREVLWEALCGGVSGVGPISLFSAEGFPVRIAAEVKDFNPKAYIRQRKSIKIMLREMLFAVAASQIAMEDAALSENPPPPERFGVVIGAGLIATRTQEIGEAMLRSLDGKGAFDIVKYGREGIYNLFPLWMLKHLPNMISSHISISHDAQGPNNTVTAGDASGHQAIGEAFRIIKRGDADVILTGGGSSRINPVQIVRYVLFDRLSRRNEEPQRACRPFDRDHDGFVLGEGAAILVLEEAERALARGATIYAEVRGFGSSVRMEGAPPAAALERAIRSAFKEAGAKPGDTDVLWPMGTGCPEEDRTDAEALSEVFGAAAAGIPVTSIKSMVGHLGPASGALEVLAAALSLREGKVPPTVNFDAPDSSCGLNVVAGAPLAERCRVAALHGQDAWGQSACLVVGEPEGVSP